MTDRSILILIVMFLSVTLAGAIIGLFHYLFGRRQVRHTVPPQAAESETVILFENGVLADATPTARLFLTSRQMGDADQNSLIAELSRHFPDLAERFRSMRRATGQSSILCLSGTDTRNQITVEASHGLVRLTLSGPLTGDGDSASHLIASLESELDILRSIAEDAPQLIWKQDADGRLTWANSAYLRLADQITPATDGDPLWPVDPIFKNIAPVPSEGRTIARRAPILLPGMTEPMWFEVTSVRRGRDTVHFAADANNLIQAESGRHKFIQTLTKTFAHLTIGLAIFDRERRLSLFNPALLDLTGLPVTFLSARPLVNSVLDRLHDMNMLPEPRNYANWRDQVAALEAAAVRGTYCENWYLPSGRTYRVTGRPHPDGAIAFLFEDISDEILLTRQFRSELETAQATLDSLDEAIAVFSPAGTLVMSNAGYARIAGLAKEALSDISITDEIRRWRGRSGPTPIWDRILRSMESVSDRKPWQDLFRLDDGRPMNCRVTPLQGGNTLIGLRTPAQDPSLTDLYTDSVVPQSRSRAISGV